jgi:gluconate 2-dehydrogenase gamma chain
MTFSEKSRRGFLKSSGTVVGASWLAINMPLILSAAEAATEKMKAAAEFKNISPQEAVEFAALADQIIPRDETPGASDIGVVYYIDEVLGGFMADALPMLRQGLEELNLKSHSVDPTINQFSGLPFAQQTAVLKSVEDTPLFEEMMFMTMCGMFSLPVYGGNRNHAGWDLLGFDHQHAWQPPFGYYDAAVHGKASVKADEL